MELRGGMHPGGLHPQVHGVAGPRAHGTAGQRKAGAGREIRMGGADRVGQPRGSLRKP